MKSFALGEDGDLLIQNKQIVMAHGTELLRQKVKCVLSTNKGEWSLNVDEGINFSNILGKTAVVGEPITAGDKAVSELNSVKNMENSLNEKLAKRLDGVSQ